MAERAGKDRLFGSTNPHALRCQLLRYRGDKGRLAGPGHPGELDDQRTGARFGAEAAQPQDRPIRPRLRMAGRVAGREPAPHPDAEALRR